jgi:maltose alpha-D-glucosyltransferase/alpha-amylase
MDPVYGFESVNVEAQSRSPSSLLNWTKRLIAARRTHRAMGRGTLRFLYPTNRKVIAYLRLWEGEIILCVANLSRSAQALELDLAEFRGRQVVEVLGRSVFPQIGEQPYLLTLQGYSFFWFELTPPEAGINSGLPALAPEFVTLVMPQGWADLFTRHNLPLVEGEVIPGFLPRQRWFAAKDRRIEAARVIARGEIAGPAASPGDARNSSFLLQVVEAQSAGAAAAGELQMAVTPYFLPLAAVWSPSGSDLRQALAPVTLAELRQFRREGALVDALSQDGFALALAEAIEHEATLPLGAGEGPTHEIRFRHTKLFALAPAPERIVVRRLGTEQSNSSVFFEEYGMLKIYRRPEPGLHPEVEMARFLVERAGFSNTPPLLATIELSNSAGDEAGAPPSALGVLFGFVRNQGDGWTLALDYLLRYLDDALNEPAPGATPPGRTADLPAPDDFFLALARQLGLRTAQLHRALAEHAGDDPAFAPEPITGEDLAEWRRDLEQAALGMLARLEAGRTGMDADCRGLADAVLDARTRLFDCIRTLAPGAIAAVKTRYHGDLHLGQVIAVQNDFYIIDFEGEPGRPLAERRRKSSPLRDVAGMIRSFDYAATAAVRQIAETRPVVLPRMVELADAWRERAVDGFRAAYRKAMRACRAYPVSKLQAKAMIDFFTLEKAVYEVNYELTNRPGWVAIPLNGILRVLAKESGSPGRRPPKGRTTVSGNPDAAPR